MALISDSPIYQRHYAAIGRMLAARGATTRDYLPNKAWGGKPQYVVEFLRQTLDHLVALGVEVGRKTLIDAESLASGHTDYQPKLALYLTEIEIGAFRGAP